MGGLSIWPGAFVCESGETLESPAKLKCWRNSAGHTAPVEGNGQTAFRVEALHQTLGRKQAENGEGKGRAENKRATEGGAVKYAFH